MKRTDIDIKILLLLFGMAGLASAQTIEIIDVNTGCPVARCEAPLTLMLPIGQSTSAALCERVIEPEPEGQIFRSGMEPCE